jgi:spermidine dehydrogenase
MAMSPGNIHQAVNMDFPTSMGGYNYTSSPDEPCILHMRCCLQGDTQGAPAIQQFKEARYRMLGMSFNDYEYEIRDHLSGMLPNKYFKFDRDVASITVNRWAHGYSYGNVSKIAIKPFGRITIANSDASGSSLMNRAIEEAWRAVNEIV